MSKARSAAPWVLAGGGAALAVGLLWARRAQASTDPRLQGSPLGGLLQQPDSDEAGDRVTELMLQGPALSSTPAHVPDEPNLPDPEAMDVEAGARMLASENPRGSRRLHIEQLWTQIRSAKPGQSLYSRITAGSGWGEQGAKRAPGRTRPVASGNPANDTQRQLVREVLRGMEASTLPEARKFFEPAVQDRAFAIGERARAKKARGLALSKAEERLIGYRRNADGVRAKWGKDGHAVGAIDGVEFWT